MDSIGQILGLAANSHALYIVGGRYYADYALRNLDISNRLAPTETQKQVIENAIDTAANEEFVCALQQGSYYGPNRDWKVLTYPIKDAGIANPNARPATASSGRLVLAGEHIYALIGSNQQTALNVFHRPDANTMNLSGKITISNATHVVVEGNYAFVLSSENYRTGENILRVIDVSNPANLREVASLAVPHPNGLAVTGGKIYVASGRQSYGTPDSETPTGLTIYEWNNGLRKIGELPLGNAQSVVVAGNVAYIGMGLRMYSEKQSGGLRVVDVSDPARPREVCTRPGLALRRLALHGDTLYAVSALDRYNSNNTLRAYDVANPAAPWLLGTPASRETLAYMKRRARRLLHDFAAHHPDDYAAFAADVLTQAGQGRASVNFDTDWLTVPILYGGGKRWQQTQHNRGRFVCRVPAFVRTRREESYPALWDMNPQAVLPLFTNPVLPRETREFALRLLRSHALPLPTLEDAALVASLQSGSALLVSQAIHQVVTALNSGEVVLPEIAAEAFFRGSAKARRSITALLDRTASDRKRNETFAARLYALASANVGGMLTRKQELAFVLLAARFAPMLRGKTDAALTVKLYATGRPDFVSLSEDAFAHLQPKSLPDWLLALNTLDAARRDRAFGLIRESIRTKQMPLDTARTLIHSPEVWIRESGWILLADSATPPDVLATLWNELVENLQRGMQDVTAIVTAFASPAALSILPRIGFDYGKLMDVLRSRPELLEWVTPPVFELLVPGLALDGLLELIGLVPDSQWQTLRPTFVAGLRKFDIGQAFWSRVFALVGAQGDTPLSRRLLDDPDLTDTFVSLPDIGDLLRSANPAFGALLGRWVAAHIETFERDSPSLLALASSMQPEIRAVGLARVQVLGMGLPFALRLVEAELPDTVEAGKGYFENIEAAREMEVAVALCDSPQRSVRQYGLRYVEARRDRLDSSALFVRLSESPDPAVQMWVAQNLRAGDAPHADVFDRAVLRQRDTGRKAKEAVKKQKANEPAPDVSLLLELARGRTQSDADWALQELAKLALNGTEIPGVTLDGAAGG